MINSNPMKGVCQIMEYTYKNINLWDSSVQPEFGLNFYSNYIDIITNRDIFIDTDFNYIDTGIIIDPTKYNKTLCIVAARPTGFLVVSYMIDILQELAITLVNLPPYIYKINKNETIAKLLIICNSNSYYEEELINYEDWIEYK